MLSRFTRASSTNLPGAFKANNSSLVHEAWLRLAGHGAAQFQGRARFFAGAADLVKPTF
jgi:hypothetical protein